MEPAEVSEVLQVVQISWPGLFDEACAYWEPADDTVRISNELSYITVAKKDARIIMVFGATLKDKEHGYGRLPYPIKDPFWPK